MPSSSNRPSRSLTNRKMLAPVTLVAAIDLAAKAGEGR